MTAKTEGFLYADMLHNARELTRWYLKMLKDVDVYKVFEIEGKQFNPVIWEVGHLAVTQNFLGLYLTNGKPIKLDWAPLFGIGAKLPEKNDYPEYELIWKAFKDVHEACTDHIATLSTEDLDAPSRKPFEIAQITTVRDAVKHISRHESTHTGHLGLLCKLYNIKTV